MIRVFCIVLVVGILLGSSAGNLMLQVAFLGWCLLVVIKVLACLVRSQPAAESPEFAGSNRDSQARQ